MVPEVIFDENVVSGRFPAFCHTLGEVCSVISFSFLKNFLVTARFGSYAYTCEGFDFFSPIPEIFDPSVIYHWNQ